jgi:hypothetical protein
VPAYQEMKKFGMKGFVDDSPSVLWFDLEVTEFYKEWKGKLIVDWPPPPITWWRWANQKEFPVHAILEDSILVEAVPRWEDIVWSWDKLKVIPAKWRDVLKQWRGIYYIFDRSDRKGYVGAAYGKDNILGRWLNYAASGHGGNTQLRKRAFTAENFSFSILQLMAHDATAEDVRKLESTWKDRLHTRPPFGLNDN